MTPSVFISHVHEDRAVAAEIDSVLRQNGAETFLDQRELGPGDQLPANLEAGIENCSSFLLLWSMSAAKSTWVNREWNLAYTKRKRIIPFTVDGFALPSPLDNFIHIGGNDRKLAYSNLLTAIFGKEFRPRAGSVFAGKWEANCDVLGVLSAQYTFELRLNGQVVGAATVGQLGGLVGPMANMNFPLDGFWTYQAGVLELHLTTEALGQRNTESIQIVANGTEGDVFKGRDLKGLTWTLKRVSAGL
jgi:hypothetical protein